MDKEDAMREVLAARDQDGTPLYRQLARNLRQHIGNGGIIPGEALPSERDLSELSGMSRVTVRKGIEELVAEGVLFRKQGAGTFVARRIETAGSALSSFSGDARLRGEVSAVVWMIRTYGRPTEEEAELLEVGATSQVARLGRVRYSNGEPLAIEHAVVPANFLPDIELVKDSLYAALEHNGHKPIEGIQRVRASLANPTEAGILCIKQNAEVLRIERLTKTAQGRPVEVTHSVYRGDRYDFVTKIKGTDIS